VGRLLGVATGPLLLAAAGPSLRVIAGPLLLVGAGPLLLVRDTAVAFGTVLAGTIGAGAGGPMVWGHAGAGRT
jgi:hypothetical protein